jgi:hypothetical protein
MHAQDYLSLAVAFAFAFALAISPSPSAAQDRPEPGTAVVPVQTDEVPSLGAPFEEVEPKISAESPGFVRLWNFAAPEAGRLAVFLVDYGKRIPPVTERAWMARGSRPGETRNYRPFKPGRYELVVIADNSSQGSMAQLPDEADVARDNLLSSRQGIEIQGADHHTVIVTTSPEGSLQVQVLNDSAVENRRLRCFNLTKELAPSITLAGKNRAQPLVDRLAFGFQEVPLTGVSGITTFQVSLPPNPSGFAASLNAEIDFSGVKSCSLLIFNDRYGRFAVSGKTDAPLPPVAR